MTYINLHPQAKTIMGSYITSIVFLLVYLFILVTSVMHESGTAPLVELNNIFDPSGNSQQAMVNMMRCPNLLSKNGGMGLPEFICWVMDLVGWVEERYLQQLFVIQLPPSPLLIHYATCLLTRKVIVGNTTPPRDIK